MQAIETKYKSYRMRSRLEARWGVFFDNMGVKWEYEKEGYILSGIPYLPDFYLPDYHCFVEIKGQEPNVDELKKADLLRDFSEESVAVFHGLPTENWGHLYCYDLTDSSGGSSDWECMLCNDTDGRMVFGVLDARSERSFYSDNLFSHSLRVYVQHPGSYYFPCVRTDIALTAAKSARFEHGENGQGFIASSFYDRDAEKREIERAFRNYDEGKRRYDEQRKQRLERFLQLKG